MTHYQDYGSDFTALFIQRSRSQLRRLGFFAGLVSIIAMSSAALLPMTMMSETSRDLAYQYGVLYAKAWVADENADKLTVELTDNGVIREFRVVDYLAFPALKRAPAEFVHWAKLGALGGLIPGLLLVGGIEYYIRRKGRERFKDRNIGGTQVVSQKQLAKLASQEAGADSLALGPIPIPERCETRHFAMIGTTGSGKTTVLRQMLDKIEARGEPALVYDTSGEFIAHYYNPARGDIILNPFDARCAFWSPFDEIAHPADADRIAHQLVSETGSHDDDVWLETSRILVANILRTLWSEGQCTLEALFDALQIKTKEELKRWLGHTSSARTFADDADRATGSVLFMLAKAANLIQFLRAERSGGVRFAFRDFIHDLDKIEGPKPWIFVPRKEDYFEAAKPLLACWLECAASAVLGLTPSSNRRIWFILDELADLPRVENLARLLPEGRKFGAAIMLTFQALGQMRHRYGPSIAESMLACCNTKLFLQTVDRETRQWASHTIGDCELEIRNTAEMLTMGQDVPRTTVTTSRQVRAAVLESELRLGKYEGYLLLPDGFPVARIALTNDHIIARGDPVQRPYVAGSIDQTLWKRTAQPGACPPILPGGLL